MKDPISSFEDVRNFYIKYLETAFRIGPASIQNERRRLLEQVGTLCTEPFIEPLPRYVELGKRIDDLLDLAVASEVLSAFDELARQAFVLLAMSGLIPSSRDPKTGVRRGEYQLYTHQLEMLRKGISSGKPGIVTSGTGSGKTEAFLLPVLATICEEGCRWAASPKLGSWSPWWKNPDGTLHENWTDFRRANWGDPAGLVSFLRSNETDSRPKAVRALVLYPMNALVEDQMVRLRRALDASEALSTMASQLRGNRIYFGRYTSAAPVTGWLRHPRKYDHADPNVRKAERGKVENRVRKLWEELKLAEETARTVSAALTDQPLVSDGAAATP